MPLYLAAWFTPSVSTSISSNQLCFENLTISISVKLGLVGLYSPAPEPAVMFPVTAPPAAICVIVLKYFVLLIVTAPLGPAIASVCATSD